MTGKPVSYKDVFADTLPAHDFRFLAKQQTFRRGHGVVMVMSFSYPSWFQK